MLKANLVRSIPTDLGEEEDCCPVKVEMFSVSLVVGVLKVNPTSLVEEEVCCLVNGEMPSVEVVGSLLVSRVLGAWYEKLVLEVGVLVGQSAGAEVDWSVCLHLLVGVTKLREGTDLAAVVGRGAA